MTFKVKKVTFGDYSTLYYPMVRKNLWSRWYYLDDFTDKRKIEKSKDGWGMISKNDANEIIDQYKSQNGLPTTISTKMF